ncbi:hypothetical protein KP509_29G046900 [Ceratopteris richardii]|uniref:Uncharacterized protein n=1 Tax=Ceratopteris richardii TaxID=49495 RepID=A0A8T2R7V4_CERRI|nr:hypothetical protein KP509_29G046900 [Ceratopteris richardii]
MLDLDFDTKEFMFSKAVHVKYRRFKYHYAICQNSSGSYLLNSLLVLDYFVQNSHMIKDTGNENIAYQYFTNPPSMKVPIFLGVTLQSNKMDEAEDRASQIGYLDIAFVSRVVGRIRFQAYLDACFGLRYEEICLFKTSTCKIYRIPVSLCHMSEFQWVVSSECTARTGLLCTEFSYDQGYWQCEYYIPIFHKLTFSVGSRNTMPMVSYA